MHVLPLCNKPAADRRAFTLLELVVAVGIIGLLLAITLPAVQQAREASRRVQCVNRLKQIGLVCHNYAGTHGYYPSHHASALYGILWDEMGEGHSGTFICPSDSGRQPTQSFLFNAGTRFRMEEDYRNGYLLEFRDRRPAEFTDGTSQTALASERLRAAILPSTAEATSEPHRYLWWTEEEVDRVHGNEPEFIEICRTRRVAVTPTVAYSPDGYDHFLTPNNPGCRNGPFATAYFRDGAVPASSLHPGAVNVLFVDGHVQFVADGIDRGVWQAVGTINGNESLGNSLF
jgi:prepilin-type processing-associated H-X9-DG protein/prepilin-type N-terminal cleavage/methylation domain-containing protein